MFNQPLDAGQDLVIPGDAVRIGQPIATIARTAAAMGDATSPTPRAASMLLMEALMPGLASRALDAVLELQLLSPLSRPATDPNR